MLFIIINFGPILLLQMSNMHDKQVTDQMFATHKHFYNDFLGSLNQQPAFPAVQAGLFLPLEKLLGRAVLVF